MHTLARFWLPSLVRRWLAVREDEQALRWAELDAEQAERNIRVAEVQQQLAIKAIFEAGRERERKLLTGASA